MALYNNTNNPIARISNSELEAFSIIKGKEAVQDNQPIQELCQLLFQEALTYNDFTIQKSFPKEALRFTLLKLVESDVTEAVVNHLDGREEELEIEEYEEALQVAYKCKHDDVVQVIENTVRSRFVRESLAWNKEKVVRWGQNGFITTEDKKRACRLAQNEENFDVAHFLMPQAGLYYDSYNRLKSHFSNSNYKRMPITDQMVPRESYINYKLWDFLIDFHIKNQPVRISPYQGSNESESEEDGMDRLAIYKQVHALELFRYLGPALNMQNGHAVKDPTSEKIVRCLVLETEQGIKGAIQFKIDTSSKVCTIHLLHVHKEYQKHHFGQTLLHSAMYVALLYKCSEFFVEATPNSFEFYKNQGFVGERVGTYGGGDLTLDVSNQSSKTTLLEKMSKTAPYISLEQLLLK